MQTGKPAAARWVATSVSNPPVASITIREGASWVSFSTKAGNSCGSCLIDQCSPEGRTARSSESLETSMRTVQFGTMLDMSEFHIMVAALPIRAKLTRATVGVTLGRRGDQRSATVYDDQDAIDLPRR